MKYKQADEEFSGLAKELYEKHHDSLNLYVHPSKVLFLRTTQKKKDAYAYCKLIHGEYELLTDKRFFIVIVSENFGTLDTEDKKKYVILHELKHLHFDDDKEKYGIIKHTLQDFHQLLVNPRWNLDLVHSDDKEKKEEEEKDEDNL